MNTPYPSFSLAPQASNEHQLQPGSMAGAGAPREEATSGLWPLGTHRLVREMCGYSPFSVMSAVKTSVCHWLRDLVWAVTTGQPGTASEGILMAKLDLAGWSIKQHVQSPNTYPKASGVPTTPTHHYLSADANLTRQAPDAWVHLPLPGTCVGLRCKLCSGASVAFSAPASQQNSHSGLMPVRLWTSGISIHLAQVKNAEFQASPQTYGICTSQAH